MKAYKLTQGQKAKLTRLENKLQAEYDSVLDPLRAEYFGFCETLYPARDSEIARAEKIMNDIIARAREDFRIDREIIMNKFESNPEVVRLGAKLEEARAKILKSIGERKTALYKEFGVE
jgi:signal transduction histidine kinase